MANEYMGWQRRLHLTANETTWGAIPGTPAYFLVPYSDCNIKLTRDRRQSQPFSGRRQRMHNQAFRRRLGGNITCPLFGQQDASNVSIAQKLIAWAFSAPAGIDLDSRTAELFDSLEVKRWTGLRVNNCTISGSEGNPITISLDVIGKDETSVSAGSAQALAAAVSEKTEFLFEDAVFTFGGSAQKMKSFSLSVANNLAADEFLNSDTIQILPAGDRVINFQFVIHHNVTTRDAILRASAASEPAAQLVLKGLHNGTGLTGNYTTVTIDIDRGSFDDASFPGGRNEVVREEDQYVILKPASSDNDVDLTYGEAS